MVDAEADAAEGAEAASIETDVATTTIDGTGDRGPDLTIDTRDLWLADPGQDPVADPRDSSTTDPARCTRDLP